MAGSILVDPCSRLGHEAGLQKTVTASGTSYTPTCSCEFEGEPSPVRVRAFCELESHLKESLR